MGFSKKELRIIQKRLDPTIPEHRILLRKIKEELRSIPSKTKIDFLFPEDDANLCIAEFQFTI